MDVKYDEELVKDIQEIFMHRIVPDNFILVIHKYNRKVLTFDDIERLRKSMSFKSSTEVNYELLLMMKKYSGWFEVILQVCNDPDVKQDDLAVAFKTIKQKLDERLDRDQTEKKEIAMGLSKLSSTSERNQKTSNGVFETDHGAMCMSSESRWQEDKNSNQLSKDNHSTPTHLSLRVGVIRKHDKPYCTVCLTGLTSDKAADDHCRGKQHQKKLKEAGLVYHDGSGTGITMAGISQATNGGAKSEPDSWSSEPSVSQDNHRESTTDYKVTPASWTPLSCGDEGNTKELLTESRSVTASLPCWGGLETKNGNLYCRICDVILTSQPVADAHCKGKPHEKKLNRAFPTHHGMSESGITTVSDFPASSASISAMPTSFELSASCETAVNSGQISDSKMASFKLTFSIDKTSTSSDSIKATPTCSGATEATLVSPNRSHSIDEATKQVSGSDKEYIVEDGNGKLKCRICDVPVSCGDNAAQHLQGSKHKKKLEALKDQDDSNETPPELGPHGEIITYGEPTGKCFVCNTPINSKESAKQHREGRRHINRCKKFNLPEM